MNTFKHPELKQFTELEARFAPPARRSEQLQRAEQLLQETDPEKTYSYQYVNYRLTNFRTELFPDLQIEGADLIHDLRQMIETLSVPADAVKEPMLTLEEVSRRWNVSTKTIRRWRERGLVGRRIVRDGRYQLEFPQSAIDRFMAANKTRVERSSRFSQLSDTEKDEILRRAKRLSRVGVGTLTEVSRRIGRRVGRSAETVRYTIRNYDRQHPGELLFPDSGTPISEETKQLICNAHRRGISVEKLAKRFGRSRRAINVALCENRARRLLDKPLEYIYHPSFDDPSLEGEIMAAMPDAEFYAAQRRKMKAPGDVPPELAPLYQHPLLSKDQEQHLFRQFNFLKHQAHQLREKLDPKHVSIQELEEIEELQKQAAGVKERLINANMRLVVSIAKRHLAKADSLWELLSDGNMSLIRAVEKFDFGRGFKFSTYASWAIMKNFARSIPDETRHRERFVTGHEQAFELAPDRRGNEQEALAFQEQHSRQVNRLLEHLEPREREIVRMRAGLDNFAEEMTLEEIGQQLGITKERVRQLNVRIMNKLRTIARESVNLS